MTTTDNPLLNTALYYAERGWPVFPLHQTIGDDGCSCPEPECDSQGKHPRTNNGFKNATTEPEQIKKWWSNWPDANIGLRTGKQSGLLVIDSDEKNGKSGKKSIREAGLKMPVTWAVRTPSGGLHYLYQYPEGTDIGCPGSGLDGVDIRGEGGYVVAPPSVIDGKSYTVASQVGIAPLPSQWVGQLTKCRHQPVQDDSGPILDGTRNRTLASFAGRMRFYGLSPSEIQAALLVMDSERCEPPVGPKKVATIARWAGGFEIGDYSSLVDFSNFKPPPMKGDGNHTLIPIELPRVQIADLTPVVQLPQLEEVVSKHLPTGVPTLLAAHGGAGKSMLGLQLAACVASGREFMGLSTMRVPVTIYSAEDSTLDLRHRFKRIFTFYNINPKAVADSLDVRDVTEISSALYVEHIEAGVRRGTTTHVFNALLDACKQNNSRLVVIDNASDVFEANENDRSLVRGFMRSLGQLARAIDGAVLLLAHVNKITAMNGSRSESYSGSTAWHNSARSRLALTEAEGGLTLSHEKANRGELCHDIPLSWTSEGLLVPGHAQFDGVQDGPDLDQILGMFEEHTKRGDPVSTSRTNGNAHLVLSPLDDFPAGVDKKRFWKLIGRAEKDGQLRRTVFKTKCGHTREVFEVVS